MVDSRSTAANDLDGDGNTRHGDPATLQDTSAFLKEVMHDDAARDKIRATTAAYVQGNLGDLPVDEDGMRDRPEVLDNGRILGVVTESDIAAAAEDIQSEKDEDARRAKIIDFAINWAGPAGRIHGGASVFTNWTLGEKATRCRGPLGRDEIADLEDGCATWRRAAGQIEGQPVHERDRDTMKAAPATWATSSTPRLAGRAQDPSAGEGHPCCGASAMCRHRSLRQMRKFSGPGRPDAGGGARPPHGVPAAPSPGHHRDIALASATSRDLHRRRGRRLHLVVWDDSTRSATSP